MKKLMLVAAVAMVFGMVGCSKKHDCKCTTYVNGAAFGAALDYKDYEGECNEILSAQGFQAFDEASKSGVKCEEM